MKIKLVKRQDPRKKDDPGKWYGNPVNVGTKTIADIAENISGRSSLTRGDILNVLSNCLDEVPKFLRDGFSVQLDELGTMRISFSSKGAAAKKDFNTATLKPRIIFTPSVRFKQMLQNARFEVDSDGDEKEGKKKKKDDKKEEEVMP